MKILKREFGKILRKLRKERGFQTQGSLAVAVETEQSTVQRWETGVFTPSDEMLKRLCAVLKVDEKYFVAPEPQRDTTLADAIEILQRYQTAGFERQLEVRRLLGLEQSLDPKEVLAEAEALLGSRHQSKAAKP